MLLFFFSNGCVFKLVAAEKLRLLFFPNLCIIKKKTNTTFGAVQNLRFYFLQRPDYRVQARGRLRRNTRPDGVNFALEDFGGEKTSPDICSFCKKSLLVLAELILKTK